MNKVNTKVDMRLRLDSADWIAEEVKAAIWRLVRELGKQTSKQNVVKRTQSCNCMVV